MERALRIASDITSCEALWYEKERALQPVSLLFVNNVVQMCILFGAGMSSPIVIYVMTHMKECMHSMDSCRELHVEYVGLASFFPELFLIPPSPVDL